MRTLFYHMANDWTGASRAFAVAARGFAAMGEPVTIACRASTPAEQAFVLEGLDVVALPPSGTVGADAWRLRTVLKERVIEVVFLHSEREHLIAGSAMRLAKRGAVVRRFPAGSSVTVGRSGKLAARMVASLFLFATEEDRARSGAGGDACVAPLGVEAATLENARTASRDLLNIPDATRLIVCAIDQHAGNRVTTVMRALALLADRHPQLRLALVGQSADKDDARMHAAALGVTSLVQFSGARGDAPAILAAADIGWVAAAGDDGAFACLDFMLAGVPVIAERSPLLSHYVPDGIAGVLLPPSDPNEIASAVSRVLANDARRTAMGNAGRTRVMRDFRESAMLDGFVGVARAVRNRSAGTAE